MGFLDKQDRVIDMVLTDEGKRLLSLGELEFSYYAFFDDEVDYSPYIPNSSSLSSADLSASIVREIEATPVREATVGSNFSHALSGRDCTNVNRPIFTMPHGQGFLPRVELVLPSSGTVEVSQRQREVVYIKRDDTGKPIQQIGPASKGYERFHAGVATIDVRLKDFFEHSDGFLLRVFSSGSDSGLKEIFSKRDFRNDRSYSLETKIFVDDESDSLAQKVVADKSVSPGSLNKG